MKRAFDLLALLNDVCVESYQDENSAQETKKTFEDMHKLLMMVENILISWSNTNYFMVKAVTQNQDKEPIIEARSDLGEDGLIMLSDELTQEFEDEYCDGGLKSVDSWDSKEYIEKIVKFVYDKNFTFKRF